MGRSFSGDLRKRAKRAAKKGEGTAAIGGGAGDKRDISTSVTLRRLNDLRRGKFLLRGFGLLVDTGFRQLAQGLVGVLFLVERSLEELRPFAIPELVGPGR